MLRKVGFSQCLVNFIFQRILGCNRRFKLSLNFTSVVKYPERIQILNSNDSSLLKCLAQSTSVYIQAHNGINLYECLNLAPGVKLISANHNPDDLKQHLFEKPIEIGRSVWLGAGVVVLPGVSIGHGAIIGAGSVVTKAIPDGAIAVGNPCRVIRIKSLVGESSEAEVGK
ncbi:DapH/DapD/GlmU-related protein [Teredinibacter turnerae]|uniref:DapH/DapD/GlmU-related protein n=1 Tax=Teredinibacter turnerae TaxID=2426 RepID=UPI00037DBE28|nr:DapH/DapD/GlmU-related protein [Teredinibacter turnerae]